jgi:hypothetical protein
VADHELARRGRRGATSATVHGGGGTSGAPGGAAPDGARSLLTRSSLFVDSGSSCMRKKERGKRQKKRKGRKGRKEKCGNISKIEKFHGEK